MNWEDRLPKRFWEKVHVRASGCWCWIGAHDGKGYGQFTLDKKKWRAPRLMWTVRYTPIPKGWDVCHHCDTPSCVNPDHLFVGTRSDNMKDAAQKGRNTMQRYPERSALRGKKFIGEANGRACLTDNDIRAMRKMRESGVTERSLAQEFGISRTNVHRIVTGQRWCHVM